MTSAVPDATLVPPVADRQAERSSTGLSLRVASVLCYAAGWLSGLVLLAIERESRAVRFHAWQALLGLGALVLLALACWGVTILMAFVSPPAFRLFAWVTQAAWLLLVVVWLVAMGQAAKGRRWRIPLVGRLAERLGDRLPG